MQTINIHTEAEMLSQLKILLENGYDVGIHQEKLLSGKNEYLIAYQKPKRERVGDG